MRILLLDNYDSFTWNLHHLLVQHAEVHVALNDRITVDQAAAFDGVVISPGPGLPREAGITMDLIEQLRDNRPILGVCLGMQAIVQASGGHLFNQPKVQHGVSVECHVASPSDPLFAALPSPFHVGLYHSWAAEERTLPLHLRITARSEHGIIMAVRHTQQRLCGVQFHPESVMTPWGGQIIRNWISSVR